MKRIIILRYFALFFILFNFQSRCNFLKYVQKIPNIDTKLKFDNLQKQYDRLSILLVFTEDPSDMIIEKYVNISNTVPYYGDFYFLTCTNFNLWKYSNYSFCTKESFPDEPAMIIFKPSFLTKAQSAKEAHSITIMGKYQLTNYLEGYIEKYIGDHVQDDTVHIEYNDIENVESQQITNLIILISNKTEVPPIFRAITKHFKDRLLFGYIKDMVIAKSYEVKNIPQIVAVKIIDRNSLEKVERSLEYYKGPVDFVQISNFCENFARKNLFTQKEKDFLSSARNQGNENLPTKYHILFDSNFSSIFDSGSPVIMHLYQKRPYLHAIKLAEQVRGLFNFYFIKDDINSVEMIHRYNLSSEYIGKFLPDRQAIEKNKTQDIRFDKSSIEYLKELVPDHTLNIVPQMLEHLVKLLSREEDRIIVIYFNEKKEEVPFEYKALALSEFFYPYIKFCVYNDPPIETLLDFKITKLPHIAGILPFTDNLTEFSQYPIFHYKEILKPVILVSYFKQLARKVFHEEFARRENPNLIEIIEMNYNTANESCYDLDGLCIIAFLPATEIMQHKKHLSMIREAVSISARMQATLMWVNATCHSEMMRDYEVNFMSMPTMVAVNLKRNTFSNMDGHFDINTIKDFLNKVAGGRGVKLNSIFDFPIPRKVNCSLILHGESEPLSEDERELLDEILEEDRRKKEDAKSGKKKSKKSNSAIKNPKKKKEEVEDL